MGDSIVQWARRALGVSPTVLWRGQSGAQFCDLQPLLDELAQTHSPPELLIIHMGTNDLVHTDFFSLPQRVSLCIDGCRTLFPGAAVVWSDTLPRMFYYGARSQRSLEKQRRALNKWSRTYCHRVGAHVLHHPQFCWTDASLYRYDGVHLSAMGNDLFRANLRQCVLSFGG